MDLFVIEGSYYDDKWLFGVCDSIEAVDQALEVIDPDHFCVHITKLTLNELRSPVGYFPPKDKEIRTEESFGYDREAAIDKVDGIKWTDFEPHCNCPIEEGIDVYYETLAQDFEVYFLSDKAKDTYRKWALVFGYCKVRNLIDLDKITIFTQFFSALGCVLKEYPDF